MTDHRPALRSSVARLRSILETVSADDLARQAYPTEWSVSDVVSHLGSGAIIMRESMVAATTGGEVADGFNQSVWDEWNAKPAEARRAETIAADQAYLDALDGLTEQQQADFQVSMGPMQLDLATFAQLRLNEHALHVWDTAVTLDPSATLPDDAADAIVDSLEMMGRWAGRADGAERNLLVHTTDPERWFTLATTADAVSITPTTGGGTPDLELPAEAFIRLVYGRLDPAHTPAGLEQDPVVADLRQRFPGF